jgi:hypothetical protein
MSGIISASTSEILCSYVSATSGLDAPDIRIEAAAAEDGVVSFAHAWVAGELLDDIIEEEAPVEEEDEEEDEDDLSTRMAASAFALAGLAMVNF